MEYFREAINSTEGRKGKSKPILGGVYKDIGVEDIEGRKFLLRANLAIRALGNISFLLSNFDLIRFSSLRLLELENSPTALVAETLAVCNRSNTKLK